MLREADFLATVIHDLEYSEEGHSGGKLFAVATEWRHWRAVTSNILGNEIADSMPSSNLNS